MKMDREITAIRVQKHNRDRLSIDLDGEFAFGLSRVTAAWLKVGERLSAERIEKLMKTDELEVAYQKATRMIGYRQRTSQEIKLKLQQKGFEQQVIDQVVARLQRADLLQDQFYARSWVENRNDSHPRSRRQIRYELRMKGIPDQMIDNALMESAQDEELALKAAAQYARKITTTDRALFSRRMASFLARRGFSFEIARSIVQTLTHGSDFDQRYTIKNEDDEHGKY